MINNNELRERNYQIVIDFINLVAIVSFGFGLTFMVISYFANFYSLKSSALAWVSNFSTGLSTGLIVTSIVSFSLEKYTKRSLKNLQESTQINLSSNITEIVKNNTASTNVLIYEIFRSLFTDEIKRHVLDGGITSAFSMWVGTNIDGFDKWFLNQDKMDIFLKDGKTFFSEKRELIKERFLNKKKTRIMIIHPHYNHLGVVAEADPYKKEKTQIEDCIVSINVMHSIRNDLIKIGIECCDFVDFIGYRVFPTWNGYIGDNYAYIYLYFSRPYRGRLNTLFITAYTNKSNVSDWYESYSLDYNELIRLTEASDENYNLWLFGS